VSAPLPQGVRLALDWGERRIGVAACDPAGLIAFPVATVDAVDPWAALAALVAEYRPTAVVLGHPIDLAGRAGPAARRIEDRAPALAERLGVGVWLVDERLTTAEAARRLRQVGRSARQQRGIVDQAAGVALLETVLAAERAGQPIGSDVASGEVD